jgi:hypothetical protein
MSGVPDSIYQNDMNSMPVGDPAAAAKIKKQVDEFQKRKAAQEKADEKERKANQAKVDKATKLPTQVQRAAKVQADEDTVAKREMEAHKIRLYFKKLGHKISVAEPKTYPKTLEGLQALRQSIEVELQSNGGIEQAGAAYMTSMGVVEEITKTFNPLGLQLSGPKAGLAATVAQNRPAWDDLMTEFAISHAEWFMVGPFKRLMMFTVQMVMSVDAANKAGAAVHSGVAASEELQDDKFQDL